MTAELPRRTPGESHIPHFRTTTPSVALLIRVATGIDAWAERDRTLGTHSAN